MNSFVSVSADEVNLGKLHNELAAGRCIGLPTETVYGLAADATDGLAVARIFEMKQRPQFNPLICHVSDLEMAESFGTFDAISRKLASDFWPGPLTLVVPLKQDSAIHPLVTAGLGSIGLRCPSGPARTLIQNYGKPLAAPSANRSGRISPTTARHVEEEFPGHELMVLDGGHSVVGLESTIVKVEPERLTLLRPGSVTAEMIHESCGLVPVESMGEKIEAPGMMRSHYAPEASVRLDCETCPPDCCWLQFGKVAGDFSGRSLNLSPDGDLREAASNLYAYLKELDDGRNSTICVSPIPKKGLGIAINDRLARASAPRGAL